MRVDLETPSGITLNFKSNIFGDLSKITCSYSYTFKLPLTANNRRVFDNADDIRTYSNKIRKRLKAVYIQNGIPLFDNANLYIDSTETCFNAVMTWGVIDGFQALKDNDISIQKLPFDSMATYGAVDSLMSDYKNTDESVRPLYNAGATYVSENGNKNTYIGYNFFPLPCVPIHKLVEKINEKYSTRFILGGDYNEGESTEMDNLIKYGVIPFVNAVQSDTQIESNGTHLYVHNMSSSYPAVHNKYNIIHGYASTAAEPMNWNKFSEVRDSEGRLYGLKNNSKTTVYATIKGYFGMTLLYVDGKNTVTITASSQSKPSLKVYCWVPFSGSSGTLTELASLEGVYGTHYTDEYGRYGDGDLRWRFSFTEKYGTERLEVEIPAGGIVFFGIEYDSKTGIYSSGGGADPPIIYPQLKPEGINLSMLRDSETDSWQIPIGSNLPDISCLTFMKALYYMIGAFPAISSSGQIVPVYYNDIRTNVLKAVVYDWSKKLSSTTIYAASSINYAVSGFAQRNYYLMKNDNLDSKDSDEETDVYAAGMGVIDCNNETLEKEKTIIQLPFYGAYLQNLKNKKFSTGETIKFWVRDDKVETKEAKPAVGIITPFPQKDSSGLTGKVWMGMKMWDGFSKILENPSYAYLARIMENPIIIKDEFLLNELDLRDLDYSIPVYLSKYGAYFAIVSITRDSKGISKCELLKLPEEE